MEAHLGRCRAFGPMAPLRSPCHLVIGAIATFRRRSRAISASAFGIGRVSLDFAPGILVAAPDWIRQNTVTLGLRACPAPPRLAGPRSQKRTRYIDPAFHAAATGETSLNLDSFAMDDRLLHALGQRTAAGADIVIAEGSMGLFDGIAAEPGRTGASADAGGALRLARAAGAGRVGQAQSAAAIALGCRDTIRASPSWVWCSNQVASDRSSQACRGRHQPDRAPGPRRAPS